MGCTSSSLDKNEYFTSLIESIENSLSFSEVPLTLLEVLVSQTFFEKTLTRSQLKTLCRQLYLPLSSKEMFLFHFMKDPINENFSTKKVLTLIVLLGRGSKNRKKRILFKIYCFQSKNSLSFDDVKQMVINIIEISIHHLLKFSITFDKNIPQEELENFITRINSQKKKLTSYFCKCFFYGSEDIEYQKFMMIFSNLELNALIKPKVIRMLTVWMFETGDKLKVIDKENTEFIRVKNIRLVINHSRSTSDGALII